MSDEVEAFRKMRDAIREAVAEMPPEARAQLRHQFDQLATAGREAGLNRAQTGIVSFWMAQQPNVNDTPTIVLARMVAPELWNLKMMAVMFEAFEGEDVMWDGTG